MPSTPRFVRRILLVILTVGLIVGGASPVLAAEGDWQEYLTDDFGDVYSAYTDCSQAHYLIGGESALWFSDDGTTFSSVLGDLVNAITTDGVYYYVATDGDGVQRSGNATTWSDSNAGGPMDGNTVTALLATNGVVLAGSYSDETVYCSSNAGANWSAVLTTAGRPRNIRNVDGTTYVAGDDGVFSTTISTGSCTMSWSQASTTGETWARTYDVYPYDGDFYVASEDGIFVADTWTSGWTLDWDAASDDDVFSLAYWNDDGLGLMAGSIVSGVLRLDSGTWAVHDPNATMELERVNKLSPNNGGTGCTLPYAAGNINDDTNYGIWRILDGNPTAVGLASFETTPYQDSYTDGGVAVTWETAWEMGTAGFYIMHKLPNELWWTRASSFIPSEDFGFGAFYDFDHTYANTLAPMCPGTNAWRLEELEFSGKNLYYGPEEETFNNGIDSATFTPSSATSGILTLTTSKEWFYSDANVTVLQRTLSQNSWDCPTSMLGYSTLDTYALSYPGEGRGDTYDTVVSLTPKSKCLYIQVPYENSRCGDYELIGPIKAIP